MRIAIVGPTHPYKGGIAQHTTHLAHQLAKAGHDVELISWKNQYPFFYPGEQFVPADKPEMAPFPTTQRVLSWKNPIGWVRWARYLRQFDQVVLVWWVPTIQGPVYEMMLHALGKKRPNIVLICHNSLPHEPRPGDLLLTKRVFSRVDKIVAHNQNQSSQIESLLHKPARIVKIPIGLTLSHAKKSGVTYHLLFFGFIRPYKGVDVLIRAMADVPQAITLTVAGEFWGGTAEYDAIIAELRLHDRVTLHDGYVPADSLAESISQADAVVLPYRSGTGSWNVEMTHACGTPVIATNTGALAGGVRDGVEGLLCAPDDVSSLAAAIRHFYEPGVAETLRRGVPVIDTQSDWDAYVAAVTEPAS